MQHCRKTINQTCSGLLSVFLFWRGYSERVESLHQKVEELQREIALLHSTMKQKQNAPVAVTLRDLQAVRLRKVGQKPQKSPDKRRSPLVTLADLQNVRLRRSNSDLPLKSRSSFGRSPGGTPLCNKENDVTDSSLDLSMTRGLGNKYLSALTKGLSPLKAV
ncbi:proline-rich 11-like protein [Labeo rohita]|uniref:Proline-rich 11-like protein n=1 Tax=Labeo rohita TaxID=84645 RepID=A0A498MGX5_LABRO|nr:proline-rich 11-like protein [Labeo rohita]RXN32583.1 proline-rich 11-like protein [Labeo rohita]